MHKCNVDFYPEIKNLLYKQCLSLFKVTNRHAVSLLVNVLVLNASKQPYGFLDKICDDLEPVVESFNRGSEDISSLSKDSPRSVFNLERFSVKEFINEKVRK